LVLTSHDKLVPSGKRRASGSTSSPYYVFKDAGFEPVLASPKGGNPPLGPRSDDPSFQTPATERFKKEARARQRFASTVPLSTVKAQDFDAVFYPGSVWCSSRARPRQPANEAQGS